MSQEGAVRSSSLQRSLHVSSEVHTSLAASLAEDHLRQCTWQQAGFNVFFSMFAAIQIPYALGQMGILGSAVFFPLIILCSWWSGHVLIDCCVRRRLFTWRDLGSEAFGPCGAVAVEVLQTVGIVLTGMVQVQGSASVWEQAFPQAPICATQWILINSVPYLLFLQIPSFGGSNLLKFATILALVLMLWQQGMFLVMLIIWGPYKYVCYNGQTFSTVLAAVTNMMFTFGIKNVLPEMAREMKDPTEMHKAWRVANSVAIPFYILFGSWGLWAFGVFNQGPNFILQFKEVPAVIAYNIAQACTGYLPLVYGQICVFMKVELRYGVLPTDWWRVSNPDTNSLRWLPPVLFRFFFRSSVVAFYVFVAEALIGVGLGNFSSLVGAVSIAAFSFYLPWLLYLKFFGSEMSMGRKLIYGFWIVFGVGVSILGIYSSAKQMSTMASAGLFTGPCKQNAFYMGEFGHESSGGHHGLENGGYSASRAPGSFYATVYSATCLGPEANINCGQQESCCQYDDSLNRMVCPPALSSELSGNRSIVV